MGPTMNPHGAHDCTNPTKCQGTVLQVTNDGFTTGPQYMGPKWQDQTAVVDVANSLRLIDYGVPAYLGLNPLKILFSEIYVSTTGSDTVGDGTLSRPYNTIQRAVDAAKSTTRWSSFLATTLVLATAGSATMARRSNSSPTGSCGPSSPTAHTPRRPMATSRTQSLIASMPQMGSSLTTTRIRTRPSLVTLTPRTSSLRTVRTFASMTSKRRMSSSIVSCPLRH